MTPPLLTQEHNAQSAPTLGAGVRACAGANARGPPGSSPRGAPYAPAPRRRARLPLMRSAAAGRVDKTHFSVKYDIKAFMEAEFQRRNLFKQIAKEGGK